MDPRGAMRRHPPTPGVPEEQPYSGGDGTTDARRRRLEPVTTSV